MTGGANATWEPLGADRSGAPFTPCFPAWTSGHANFTAAWATAMKHFFGRDDVSFTAHSEDPHTIKAYRRMDSFSQVAQEGEFSRLWLGVRFRWDAEGGRTDHRYRRRRLRVRQCAAADTTAPSAIALKRQPRAGPPAHTLTEVSDEVAAALGAIRVPTSRRQPLAGVTTGSTSPSTASLRRSLNIPTIAHGLRPIRSHRPQLRSLGGAAVAR